MDISSIELNSDAKISYALEGESEILAEENNLTKEQDEEQTVRVSNHRRKIKSKKPPDYDYL